MTVATMADVAGVEWWFDCWSHSASTSVYNAMADHAWDTITWICQHQLILVDTYCTFYRMMAWCNKYNLWCLPSAPWDPVVSRMMFRRDWGRDCISDHTWTVTGVYAQWRTAGSCVAAMTRTSCRCRCYLLFVVVHTGGMAAETASVTVLEQLPESVLNDLRQIASWLLCCGYDTDFMQAYATGRSMLLTRSLSACVTACLLLCCYFFVWMVLESWHKGSWTSPSSGISSWMKHQWGEWLNPLLWVIFSTFLFLVGWQEGNLYTDALLWEQLTNLDSFGLWSLNCIYPYV